MDNTITEILQPILYAVITTVIPIIVANATKYLITKRERLSTQITNVKLNAYISNAITAVKDAVMEVSQTYVDSLKKKGNFDSVAQKEAKNKAINTALALITSDAKEAIETLYGDFNSWLDVKIEAIIKENK